MADDHDFAYAMIALVAIILGITGIAVYGAIEHDKREIEMVRLCQSTGKEVVYRESLRVIYSECK